MMHPVIVVEKTSIRGSPEIGSDAACPLRNMPMTNPIIIPMVIPINKFMYLFLDSFDNTSLHLFLFERYYKHVIYMLDKHIYKISHSNGHFECMITKPRIKAFPR